MTPEIVRRTLLPLTFHFEIRRLTPAANFGMATLRLASAVAPAASVSTARSACVPTSSPTGEIAHEYGAAVIAHALRDPMNTSSRPKPAGASGVKPIVVRRGSDCGTERNRTLGASSGERMSSGVSLPLGGGVAATSDEAHETVTGAEMPAVWPSESVTTAL